MAISTNGTVIARLAGGLYNTVMSNATYLEVASQDPSTLANTLYSRDFAKSTDLEVATTLLANLGLASQVGLDAWVAAQLTAAGAANKGAKIVSLLNDFAGLAADATWGTYATAFNTKVDTALAASQVTGAATGSFNVAIATTAKSLSLTTAIETLTGGAGDDVFTAPATNATTGAAATTVNSGDTINGGAGNDTLTIEVTSTQNGSLTGLSVTDVENIVITGSDNLGGSIIANTSLATATTAKAAADLALVEAQNQYNLAVQVKAAYTAVKALTEAGMTSVAALTVSPSTAFTLAQYKAAATASQASLTGGTLVSLVTDDSAMQTRATALETEANSVVTAKDTALTAASLAAATASTNYNAQASAVTAVAATASISASSFVNATSIAVDGVNTNVTALGDTRTVTLSGSSAANTLKYSAGATTANVKTSGYSGTITLDDNSTTSLTTTLKTANVNGTIKVTAASTTNKTAAANNTLTIADTLSTSAAGTVETLNLGITTQGTVATSGMALLKSLNASTSTGNLTLTVDGAYLSSVKGGSGNDTISADFDTDINGGVNIATSASIEGGAGNDKISLSSDSFGTGTLTIDGGAGDDSVTLNTAALTASVTVKGGDGSDTFAFASGTALTFGELTLIGTQVSGFEKFSSTTLTSLDASKLASFTGLSFSTASAPSVTKVANAQALTFGNSGTAQSELYILNSSPTGIAANLTATQYGGALGITASGASKTITAKAESVTLNVNNVISSSAPNTIRSASDVTLTGDVKTAVVNLAASADYATGPSTDIISSITVTPTNTQSSTAGTDSGNFTALGGLTSLTLKGVGTAKVDNSANSGTLSYSKLVTIDASGLGGVYGTYDTTNAGLQLGSLRATTNTYLAETVTLGSGKDLVNVNSTADKMDTINGFSLVMNSDGTVNSTKSDTLGIMHSAAFVKVTTGLTGTTLGAVLTQVAALATDNVVFQYGGDTYLFVDATGAGVLDAADTVVKLTGAIDLDGLVLAQGASQSSFTAL
jgi:hypothetical protein